MRLKSFHAKTMGEAMRQVRMALGDDAIIVATREEDGGTVRVTAAIEDDAPAPTPAKGTQPKGGGRTPPPEPVADVADVVADALQRHGLPAGLTDRLLDTLIGLTVDDPVVALGAALDAVFSFQPLPEGTWQRPLVLVGPPGVGKTLTTAKLAARAVFKNRTVGVITTDTVRAGGVDQLAAFTRLLKLKLITVDDPAALPGAVMVNKQVDQTLIDTAGRNPFDAEDVAELREMLGQIEAEPVLVLPAGLDAAEACEIAGIFRALGARRMLVTRLDTVRRLGSVLAASYDSRLNFCDVSATPQVANGLTALNPMALARLILPGRERTARAVRQTGTHS